MGHTANPSQCADRKKETMARNKQSAPSTSDTLGPSTRDTETGNLRSRRMLSKCCPRTCEIKGGGGSDRPEEDEDLRILTQNEFAVGVRDVVFEGHC